ncbi:MULTISPECIES: sensor histidine kinase [Pseudofrankia]|uniref:sensor histidine kinase n=1 Tax=Pseudofrankia TaxID=2994363 RepID=UPI000234DB27|nr:MULTISPECIES: histidine kinase [Pseudofrankia]OHV32826.1 two-component sensor histidine kinase [Pseudofrankia sp. EUN1h]
MTINRSVAGGTAGATGATGWRRLLSESRRPTRWDIVVTVAMLVTMTIVVVVRSGTATFPSTELLLLTVASWLPLLVRTYWPELVLAAVVVVEACHLAVMHDLDAGLPGSTVGAYQPVPLATMIAVYTVAARRRQRDGWIAGAAAASILLAAALLFQPLSLAGTDLVMVQLVVIAAGVGVGIRARHDARTRRAREAREQSRQAVLDERLRIARELHDTLAHNLALVDAQAAVADYLLDTDPLTARQALRGITQHTSAAIDDLRAALVLLRRDPDDAEHTGKRQPAGHPLPATDDQSFGSPSLAPVAGLKQLGGLLGRFRDAGAHVTLDVHGQAAALSHQSDLAAYRIVQEALTNATKHAPGAPVSVTMRWAPGQLRLEIHNSRSVRPGQQHPVGTGHGLIGLRERARAAGGTFGAGPTGDGGYLVTATLSTRAQRTTDHQIVPAVGADRVGTDPTETERPAP